MVKRKFILNPLLSRMEALIQKHYGEELLSVVIYGSIARTNYNELSDIDVLLVIRKGGSMKLRKSNYDKAKCELKKSSEWLEAKKGRLPYKFQPLILTLDELRAHPPILLDMTQDGLVLFDRDNVFKKEIKLIRQRLKELGSKRIWLDKNRWYWILKPDIKFGEEFEI